MLLQEEPQGLEGAEPARGILWVLIKPRDELTGSPAVDFTREWGRGLFQRTSLHGSKSLFPCHLGRGREEGRKSPCRE